MTNLNYPINDPHFRTILLDKSSSPNLLCYLGMHQCYSEVDVYTQVDELLALGERELGERLVRNCIKFGHWSVAEHVKMTFNVCKFPHSVISQLARHRIISPSVQSGRYTSLRISHLLKDRDDSVLEEIFYLRPVGHYLDREGHKYFYSEEERAYDIDYLWLAVEHYTTKLNRGHAPEHARDLLPYSIRQSFVVTMNARAIMHVLDLRLPKDSQIEIRTMAQMMFEEFEQWMPEVADYYKQKRYGKNKLSP